jgi:hypothetical protein
MPKLMKLLELGTDKPLFVNFDNVQFIEVEGHGTAINFSKDHRIIVTEKPETIASNLASLSARRS